MKVNVLYQPVFHLSASSYLPKIPSFSPDLSNKHFQNTVASNWPSRDALKTAGIWAELHIAHRCSVCSSLDFLEIFLHCFERKPSIKKIMLIVILKYTQLKYNVPECTSCLVFIMWGWRVPCRNIKYPVPLFPKIWTLIFFNLWNLNHFTSEMFQTYGKIQMSSKLGSLACIYLVSSELLIQSVIYWVFTVYWILLYWTKKIHVQ